MQTLGKGSAALQWGEIKVSKIGAGASVKRRMRSEEGEGSGKGERVKGDRRDEGKYDTHIPMNTNMTTTRSLRTDDQNSSSAKPSVPKRERMTMWSEG